MYRFQLIIKTSEVKKDNMRDTYFAIRLITCWINLAAGIYEVSFKINAF